MLLVSDNVAVSVLCFTYAPLSKTNLRMGVVHTRGFTHLRSFKLRWVVANLLCLLALLYYIIYQLQRVIYDHRYA